MEFRRKEWDEEEMDIIILTFSQDQPSTKTVINGGPFSHK